ncbi:MAG TPA: hypothetical protein VHK63_00190 [Candidatus Limnocylindria bacterium]|nr:hypothetical protein [Candidatus Limnocylindria bacterium]
MDDRQIRLQLEIIRVTYRAEAARLDPRALADVQARSNEILDRIEALVAGDGHLRDEVRAVRREIG